MYRLYTLSFMVTVELKKGYRKMIKYYIILLLYHLDFISTLIFNIKTIDPSFGGAAVASNK